MGNFNQNFPTNQFPSPGGCGTANAPFYNTYSPAFTCPGENQGVNSVSAISQPMIFGLTAPTGSWLIPSSTATRYIYFSGSGITGPCATLATNGLPDGTSLVSSDDFTSNDQADVDECIWGYRMTVANLIITPSDSTVTQLNGQQTLPSFCNACYNASVIATCTGSCGNQLTAANIAIGGGAAFTLIVPASSGSVTVQICAGCQVETPSFTSCGIPQTSQAIAPVASFCPPVGNGRQF